MSKLPVLKKTLILFISLVGKHGSHGVLHLGLVVQEKLKTVENEVSIKMSQLFKSTVVILKKKKRKKKEHAVIAYGHSLYYTDFFSFILLVVLLLLAC